MVLPQKRWFMYVYVMENPIQLDDLGVPPYVRSIVSNDRTLEADPKFETFDAFLRKRQRLGSNVQDSLLTEIAYFFSPRFVNMYRPETD